jgi:O-antigen ligase
VLTTVCLALTFTRSAWIGFVVALGVVFAVRKRVLLSVLVAALVLVYVLAPAGFQDRITSIVDLKHERNVERVYMWKAGFEIFKDHPLVGVGLMDLSEIYDRYRPPEAREDHGHFHNIFIQVAAARGAVGLVAFFYLLWAMGAAIWRGFRLSREESPFAGALALGAFGAYLGFIVSGLFEWNFGDSEVIMLVYFLVGIGIASTRLSSDVG